MLKYAKIFMLTILAMLSACKAPQRDHTQITMPEHSESSSSVPTDPNNLNGVIWEGKTDYGLYVVSFFKKITDTSVAYYTGSSEDLTMARAYAFMSYPQHTEIKSDTVIAIFMYGQFVYDFRIINENEAQIVGVYEPPIPLKRMH